MQYCWDCTDVEVVCCVYRAKCTVHNNSSRAVRGDPVRKTNMLRKNGSASYSLLLDMLWYGELQTLKGFSTEQIY